MCSRDWNVFAVWLFIRKGVDLDNKDQRSKEMSAVVELCDSNAYFSLGLMCLKETAAHFTLQRAFFWTEKAIVCAVTEAGFPPCQWAWEHGLPSLAPETMEYVIDSEPFLQLRRTSQCGAISATAKDWDQDRETEFISFLCHLPTRQDLH